MDISPSTPGEMLKICPWQNGVEGQINGNLINSYVSSNEFLKIKSINKPATVGYVTLYAIDQTTSGMWLLGKYGPSETQPGYRRYRIMGKSCEVEGMINLMVKLRYEPCVHDTDLLLIQSIPALQYMCKALHHIDNENMVDGVQYQQMALRILDKRQTNSNPFQEIDIASGDSLVGSYTNLV